MASAERCVYTASGQVEAEQVRAFLEASGIPSALRGESLTKTHGVTVSELGRVDVFVAEADADRANELLASVERGDLELTEDDDLGGFVRVSAVVFDMDGLMLDTERIALVIWRQAAADLGFTLDDEVAERMVGRTSATNRLMLQMHFGDRFSYDDLSTLADTRYRETLARDGVPRKEGLVELLDFLTAREIPRAVATSTASDLARHKLEQAGVARYFDVIVGGNDVAHGKPAPDIFLRAAERLGKLASECVALEDSGPGIHAASGAGMITILIPDGGRMPSPDTRERASFVAESLVSAKPIVQRLIDGWNGAAGL